MAQELTNIANGTMDALNQMASTQATEMANMASVNTTLMQTIKQQQQDIAELKCLMTAMQPNTKVNNDSETMKKLYNMMQVGRGKKGANQLKDTSHFTV